MIVTVDFGGAPLPGDNATARYAIQESPVVMIGRSAPSYPAALRDAGIEGEVIVQFVVDSMGAPDLARFRAGPDAQPLFVEAIRAAVANQRFTPAQRDCRRVPQLVQQPFTFALRSGSALRARP